MRLETTKLTPPRIYQVCIALMALLHFVLPGRQIIEWPYRSAGIVLFAGGVGLAIWAKHIFQRAGTPIHPAARPLRIHAEGPFAVSRNPMYLGICVGLAGIGVLLGLLAALLVPPLFFLATDRVFIPVEERALQAALPGIYASYRARVRRWI